MSKSTMIEMVAELEKIPKHPLIDGIIIEAKAGEYHDFKNEKYACGKWAVVGFLQAAAQEIPNIDSAKALMKIRQDVIDGEYDESPDDDDKKAMREDIIANTKSPQEAEALMKLIGADK